MRSILNQKQDLFPSQQGGGVELRAPDTAPFFEGNRFVILSTASGGGHISAARAIEGAFAANGEASSHVETLQYCSNLYSGIYNHGFLRLVEEAPWAYRAAFRMSNRPRMDVPQHLSVAHWFNARKLRNSLKVQNPKVLVCTHFLPEQIALVLKRQGKISSKIAVVVTDQVAHAQWFGRADAFFVGNPMVKEHLLSRGVPAENIFVTGIPIDLKFSRQIDKYLAREKLSLQREGGIVLLTGGGHGVGGVSRTVQDIFPTMPKSSQLVVMCGKGHLLLETLSRYKESLSQEEKDRLVLVGFTKEMEWYMAAGDLMIGKPGGLTSAETLAMGLPFVMVNAMPGQEEGNADFIASSGAGIWLRESRFLPVAIRGLLESSEWRKQMGDAARRISRPHAAAEIRVELLKLAEE